MSTIITHQGCFFSLKVDSWEEKAKSCMAAKPRLSLAEVDALVREGEAISSGLPTLPTLKESLRKAREWLSKAEGLKHPDNYPYVDSLEALVARGRPLPVRLDPLPFLETQVNSARAWRERTGNYTFLLLYWFILSKEHFLLI